MHMDLLTTCRNCRTIAKLNTWMSRLDKQPFLRGFINFKGSECILILLCLCYMNNHTENVLPLLELQNITTVLLDDTVRIKYRPRRVLWEIICA